MVVFVRLFFPLPDRFAFVPLDTDSRHPPGPDRFRVVKMSFFLFLVALTLFFVLADRT